MINYTENNPLYLKRQYYIIFITKTSKTARKENRFTHFVKIACRIRSIETKAYKVINDHCRDVVTSFYLC